MVRSFAAKSSPRGALPHGATAAEFDAACAAAVPAGRPRYSDEKVANREIRVWHFVIENGY